MLREVWRSLRMAFSFICRTLSRVRLNFIPISSNVSECDPLRRIDINEIHRFFQIFHRRWRLPVGSDVRALETFGAAAAATKLRHGVRQSQLDLAAAARDGRHLR